MVAINVQMTLIANHVFLLIIRLIIPIAVHVLLIVIVAPMGQLAHLVIPITIYLHQTLYVMLAPLNVRPALSKLIQIALTVIQTESTLQIATSVNQDILNIILQIIIVKVVHIIVRIVPRTSFVQNVFHPTI
jgi:hypothetical protein